jgi:tRNA A37 threonylcarbamoyladenosine dehydratase
MWNERMKYLIGQENVELLTKKRVVIFGVGGVGSYACEALARSGIGSLVLIDHDVVDVTNINRQIPALHSTVGLKKVDVMKQRIADINPECNVAAFDCFMNKDNINEIMQGQVDFIVDAIDTVTSKLDLYEYAQEKQIPIISSLGMANRLDPTKVIVTRLDKTENDPLAKSVRTQARRRNLSLKVPVVFSTEIPITQNKVINEDGQTRKEKYPVSSSPFVPSSAGLACASYVVRTLIE